MLIKDSQKTIQLRNRQLQMIQSKENPNITSLSNPQAFVFGQQYKYRETSLQTSNSPQNQQNALPQHRRNVNNAVPSLLSPLVQSPPQKDPTENTIPQEQRLSNANSLVYNLFYKQYKLIKTPKHLVIFFVILTLLFLCIAAFSLYFGLKVKELKIKYVQQNKCIRQAQVSSKCSLSFQLKQDIPGPVYVIQFIQNISINHRKFLQQVSLDQLKGKVISKEIAEKQCGKFVLNNDIYSKVSWANQTLASSNIASPCGVKSQGFFNDTFGFYHNGEKVEIDSSNVHQRNIFEIHRAPSSQTTQWIDPQQQHFKQYLVDGSLMTKKKLWGVINNGLKAGKYSLVVNNNYRMPDMLLSKGLFLSTTTIMGGRQAFYPIVFALLAAVCIGYIIFIEIKLKGFPENNTKYKLNPYSNDGQKYQAGRIIQSSHV